MFTMNDTIREYLHSDEESLHNRQNSTRSIPSLIPSVLPQILQPELEHRLWLEYLWSS